jgi:Uncharacterized protein, putative amidase
MYSIGQFSLILKVSTRTLRHYDEIGLLKPSYVSKDNNYRYYEKEQINNAKYIINLKESGLALDEIKGIISNKDSNRFKETIGKRLMLIEDEIQKLIIMKNNLGMLLKEDKIRNNQPICNGSSVNIVTKDELCVISKTFPIGYNECVMNYPGTIFYRSKTIENLLIDFGESIARSGISKIVIINHHLDLGHIKAIENAKEYLLAKFNLKLFEVTSRIIYSDKNHKNNMEDRQENQEEIHADKRETSFMLYKHPELVRSCYKNLKPVYLDIRKFIMSGKKCFRDIGLIEGYIGSPGDATREYGEKQFKDMITQTGNLILRFLKNEDIPEISSRLKEAMNRTEWR